MFYGAIMLIVGVSGRLEQHPSTEIKSFYYTGDRTERLVGAQRLIRNDVSSELATTRALPRSRIQWRF